MALLGTKSVNEASNEEYSEYSKDYLGGTERPIVERAMFRFS